MVEITDFQSLLEAVRAQHEPQRLLFVFARTVLPDDHDEAQAERFRAGQGGALMPLMYVDKKPEDLSTFDDLVEESKKISSEKWRIVLVAVLSGHNGIPPSAEQTDETFKALIKTIHAGGDLTQLLAFDRDGDPIQFM